MGLSPRTKRERRPSARSDREATPRIMVGCPGVEDGGRGEDDGVYINGRGVDLFVKVQWSKMATCEEMEAVKTLTFGTGFSKRCLVPNAC